jgi:hypothetical protein
VIDGNVRSVTSGASPLSERARAILDEMGLPGTPTRVSDVEIKTATLMRDKKIRHATVVVNHVVCVGDFGCDTLVPVILPAGATLTVRALDGEGNRTSKTYQGGAMPWWRD